MTNGLKTVTLAELYIKQDHPQKAIQILKELLKDSPDDEKLIKLLDLAKSKSTKTAEKKQEDAAVIQSSKFIMSDSSNEEFDKPNDSERLGDFSIAEIEASEKTGSLTSKAIGVGVAVVDNIAERATTKLNALLNRIKERRR